MVFRGNSCHFCHDCPNSGVLLFWGLTFFEVATRSAEASFLGARKLPAICAACGDDLPDAMLRLSLAATTTKLDMAQMTWNRTWMMRCIVRSWSGRMWTCCQGHERKKGIAFEIHVARCCKEMWLNSCQTDIQKQPKWIQRSASNPESYPRIG